MRHGCDSLSFISFHPTWRRNQTKPHLAKRVTPGNTSPTFQVTYHVMAYLGFAVTPRARREYKSSRECHELHALAGRHERRTSVTAPDDLDPQVKNLGDCSRLYVKLEVSNLETPQAASLYFYRSLTDVLISCTGLSRRKQQELEPLSERYRSLM